MSAHDDNSAVPAGIPDELSTYLRQQTALEFAVLVGSRASGQARASSDWDIAVQWQRDDGTYLDQLERMENLRRDLARVLKTTPDRVDLIDVPSAKLAMRELIANRGEILAGDHGLPWIHFLHRTWRELEDYYWDELYVA